MVNQSMNAQIGGYAEYRDSGVDWLGDIPAHWSLPALGYRYSAELGKMLDAKHIRGSHLVPYLRNTDVQWGRINTESLPQMDIPPSEYGRYTLRKGDLLVCEGGEVGRAAFWEGAVQPCGFQKALHRIRPRRPEEDDPKYLCYLLYLLAKRGVFAAAGNESTIVHLTGVQLRAYRIPTPPKAEQSAIAKYLAHVDRKIDRFIRSKRRMIELLNEQKQAIIHQAVTRGLDPSVPMKDSGVEWLGEIPAHWSTMTIARFAKVGNGSTPSRSNPHYWNEQGYPWLNSAVVSFATVSEGKRFVSALALQECHLPRVRPGSVLIAITGQGKTRGKATLLEIEATINQHLAFISPRDNRVNSEYLRLFLTSAYSELRRISDASGSTRGALTCEDVKRFRVAIPPTGEQGEIVARVAMETDSLNGAISRTSIEIDLVSEYRTRLISDVVTGKIDIRLAAATLPEFEDVALQSGWEDDFEANGHEDAIELEEDE